MIAQIRVDSLPKWKKAKVVPVHKKGNNVWKILSVINDVEISASSQLFYSIAFR